MTDQERLELFAIQSGLINAPIDRNGKYSKVDATIFEQICHFAKLVSEYERDACLADSKTVLNLFESMPASAEIKLLKAVTAIFSEAIEEAVVARGKA